MLKRLRLYRYSSLGLAFTLLALCAACSSPNAPDGVTPEPPGGSESVGGPPPISLTCYFYGSYYDAFTGILTPILYYGDTLTFLAGGRYASKEAGSEGTYTFESATSTVRYTSGPYADAGFVGTYEPPEARPDGLHFVHNVAETEDGPFTYECYNEEEL